ncbi:hypothetical protein HC028_26830 [Planosporangium flavigriseum]|nr:cytosine permease [Planosporangium flavigriseum]NJC68090.1 hypothetical protein [Planosporangium flavigriseum]
MTRRATWRLPPLPTSLGISCCRSDRSRPGIALFVKLGIAGSTRLKIAIRSAPGLAIPLILLVLHGPIATNILNMYSCSLCAQTLDWKTDRRKLTYGVGVLAMIFTVVLIYEQDFAHTLDGRLASMVTWVAPWAAVMLIHYWLFAKERIDVDALFDTPGST